MRLTGRQESELRALSRKPGLWSGVQPYASDSDLDFYLRTGLVRHIGTGKGYEITDAGRSALQEQRR